MRLNGLGDKCFFPLQIFYFPVLQPRAQACRENEHLRESLLLESKESKAFDNENVELFDVVHKNHDRR